MSCSKIQHSASGESRTHDPSSDLQCLCRQVHEISVYIASANSEGSIEPAHMCRQAMAIAARMHVHKTWMFCSV